MFLRFELIIKWITYRHNLIQKQEYKIKAPTFLKSKTITRHHLSLEIVSVNLLLCLFFNTGSFVWIFLDKKGNLIETESESEKRSWCFQLCKEKCERWLNPSYISFLKSGINRRMQCFFYVPWFLTFEKFHSVLLVPSN